MIMRERSRIWSAICAIRFELGIIRWRSMRMMKLIVMLWLSSHWLITSNTRVVPMLWDLLRMTQAARPISSISRCPLKTINCSMDSKCTTLSSFRRTDYRCRATSIRALKPSSRTLYPNSSNKMQTILLISISLLQLIGIRWLWVWVELGGRISPRQVTRMKLWRLEGGRL